MTYRLPRTLILAGIGCLLAAVGCAEDWTVQGQTYANVRVQELTPAAVTIFHSKGITKLPLADLAPALQERLGYDPEAAAGWTAEQERRRAAERVELAARLEAQEVARLQERPAPGGDPQVIPPEDVRFHAELDLRPFYAEKGLYAKNQGRRPSCTIFALVSALEYEQARRTGQAERLSEEFLIWATRQLQPGIPLDTGFNFPEVITALQTYGVPPHAVMPNTYGRKVEEIQPDAAAIAAARARRTVVPVWFRRDDPYLVERIVGVLNQRKPVIIGLSWPHWRTLEGNFLLRSQKPLENAAHAVTLVGYRNKGGGADGTTFIFRNSYGNEWGLAGCGFIHASYLRENLIGACFLRVP